MILLLVLLLGSRRHGPPISLSEALAAPLLPPAAACFHSATPRATSLGTPRPLQYRLPRLPCASAWPCAAACFHSSAARS